MLVGGIALLTPWALAQGTPGPVQPSTAPPKPAQPSAPPASQPSLDELLGITKPKAAGKQPEKPVEGEKRDGVQPADPSRADLDRRLAGQDVSEDFLQAVSMMRETSERLTSANDTGLETQRLQQEVLKRLDKMIEDAKKNQKSKQKQKQQQQQDQDQQQNQEQQQSSQQKQQQQQQQSAQTAQGGNVPKQNAQLKAPPAGASASWGDLPPHVREALLQGFSDKFSATYEQLTQEYYKRLAEQKPAAAGSTPSPTPTPPGGGH